MTASRWTREAVAALAHGHDSPEMPLIAPDSLSSILPGYDCWDHWPVQEEDGRTAEIAGGILMLLLTAPIMGDPEARHGHARIRVMHVRDDQWTDLGNLLPEGFSPGSREWAGSAFVSAGHDTITLYFTAAGARDEAIESFTQRLFETRAPLSTEEGMIHIGTWTTPRECVVPDGHVYVNDFSHGGVGTIKAFRDPFWFRDPADDVEYLLFTASLAQSTSAYNGAIGKALRGPAGNWRLDGPLIDADGVNNELERPHIVLHGGLYYCFWSTQRKVFDPDGPVGPTGLYGMVADRMAGPWRPVNGTGLVLANPLAAPFQTFSWLVLDDLSVLSFVDMPGLLCLPDDPAIARAHFGGTPAPRCRLRLEGDRSMLA
ncbi:glycoside hydrolase family 68 protein [Sphingobium algorifonticola]|uniref:Glycoside hydrolase family 68 protein n=1 Tax=Sphingobium algorifonticola TaxID=2008318 RepID=A0A437J9C7_9SPHN|nr:glycoside hydrolase family 68 protein [Sphingobium algorifonticola]RVT42074.1 glycoside hydrolase family 68 protein [Sphingobium algorifonticola]